MSSHLKNLISVIILIPTSIILALLLFNPNIINRKTPGTFEYIRKAESLLEKGKYQDAIRYYERAYEASPGSELIRSYLIYAYSRYANSEAQQERYDTGVEYLAKAYDLVQNQYTTQNLALMYGKRAVFRVKKLDWKGSEADLETGCEIVESSVNATKNFALSLFNDAVSEFKDGRDDSAILLLKAAVLLYGDSRIYELLGDIYYKKNDLERSQFYFDKASKHDPENKLLSEKLEKVVLADGMSRNEETKSLPYFEIKYEKGLIADADQVAETLRKAYIDVGRDFNYYPLAKTTVFFYSERDFRRIFKLPSIVRAFYDGNIRIPYPENVADSNELISYLYHEYTHAVLSAMTNNNCPAWLSEGIAVYEEMKWTRPGARIRLQGQIEGNPGISIEGIDAELKTQYKNDPSLAVTYMTAFTAIEYIVDNWGMKGLNALLKRIADGQHVVNAIDDEFLLSEKEFHKRWNEYVVKKYSKK